MMGGHDMPVSEIKLQEIIQRKVLYIESSDIYKGMEFEYVKKGEINAYQQMISDISNMCECEFVDKYLKILQEIEREFDMIDDSNHKNTIEELAGYNNAVVFVLSLINPQYEFERDEH